MAAPERKPDSVYDDYDAGFSSAEDRARDRWGMDETAESNDDSSVYEDSDSGTAQDRANKRWGLSPDQLKDAEESADQPEAPSNEETNTIPYEKDGRIKLKGRFSRRQKAIGGGTIGAIIAAVIGIASVAQGPLQLIHLSQKLLPNFGNQDHASDVRVRGLYRWAKTSNVAETRVGILGSKMYPKITASLTKNGITITHDKLTGQISLLSIEPAKNPLYQGLSSEEARARIAADNGIDPSKVSQTSGLNGGKFSFSIRESSVGAKRAAIKSHVQSQKLGRIKTALQIRTLGKIHNAPSWLHPLKRVSAGIDLKISTRVQNSQRFKDFEKKRNEKVRLKTEAQKARAAAVKSKLKIGAGVAGAVLGTVTAICVAKDVAGEIPALNRENIVIPAMKSGVDAIALGEQLKSNRVPKDGMAQIGTIVGNLKDAEGRPVWSATALRSEMGKDGGVDIDPDIKQAFSPDSNAANVEKTLDELGAESLCSGVGQVVATIGGTALLLVPGVGVAAKAASVAAGIAAITAITTFLPKVLDNDASLGTLHQGPNGGNIDAYGAREAANSSFRSTGGSELTPAQSAVLRNQRNQLDKEEFQSKSFAGRMFDVYDHRSLAGRFIDASSGSPTQNIRNIASGLLSGAWLSNLSSVFTPKAYAAQTNYDYGFPEYGFSQGDLDNPRLEDPYANAEEVAKSLNNPALAEGIKKKVKQCFGVDIVKGSSGWDAITTADINPSSAEYLKENCVEGGNQDWLRVRFFVFDSQAMNSYACYEGDEESCKQLGIGESSQPAGSAALPGAAGAAKGVDTSAQTCKVGKDAGPGDTPNPNIKIRLCNVGGTIVNVAIEANVKAIQDGGKAAGLAFGGSGYRSNARQIELRKKNCPDPVNSPSDKCSPPTAKPGNSLHEWGLAVDLTCSGVIILSRSSACFSWLKANQGTHNLINLPSEPWHWSSTGN